MPPTEVFVKRYTYWIFIVIAFIPIMGWWIFPLTEAYIHEDSSNSIAALVTKITFALIFIYGLQGIIIRRSKLKISTEGIKISRKGFFKWESVSFFNLLTQPNNEDPDLDYLELQLKNGWKVKTLVMNLDKSAEDIRDLIRLYNPELTYMGQHKN